MQHADFKLDARPTESWMYPFINCHFAAGGKCAHYPSSNIWVVVPPGNWKLGIRTKKNVSFG